MKSDTGGRWRASRAGSTTARAVARVPPTTVAVLVRLRHIVHGDEDDDTSGGHLYGLGRPDKTEYPAHWDEEKIAREVKSVADNPDTVAPRLGGAWLATGTRDGVTIHVFVRNDGSIASGFPKSGPGIQQNPPEGGA